MPIPQKMLNEGEHVAVDVRPHVWALAGPVAITVVVVAGASVAAAYSVPTLVAWIIVALLVLALVNLLARYVRWRATSLIVTNLRMIRRSGVVSRSGREIPLTQLADISYRQSLFERIIGAGDLRLESAGRDSDEVFAAIPHPAEVQNEIYQLMAARQGGGGTNEPTLSIPEQIDKLDDLRRRGVINEDEFASAKAKLLGSE